MLMKGEGDIHTMKAVFFNKLLSLNSMIAIPNTSSKKVYYTYIKHSISIIFCVSARKH